MHPLAAHGAPEHRQLAVAQHQAQPGFFQRLLLLLLLLLLLHQAQQVLQLVLCLLLVLLRPKQCPAAAPSGLAVSWQLLHWPCGCLSLA
jgi:hypothetical protein